MTTYGSSKPQPARTGSPASGHPATGNPAQDDWNKRHEALAQDLMATFGCNPAEARHRASRQMREAGDVPPLEIRAKSLTGQSGASGGGG